MTTDKKNQHYIPKFYLRYFSYQNNGKQVGLFNINNHKYIQQAPLKNQGSKNFYYGDDGKIEDGFSMIEKHFAKALSNVISIVELPKKHSEEHWLLLLFAVLTDLRNPRRIEGSKESMRKVQEKLQQSDPTVGERFNLEMSHERAIKSMVRNSSRIVEMIEDLECKLLLNTTNTPFVTSDYPVVKYNQFLEKEKFPYNKCNFLSAGLQIFIPINPKIMIVFYDSSIYKIGNQRKVHKISSKTDIDNLNILQFVNCIDTVFFHEECSSHYINELYSKAIKLPKAHQIEVIASKVVDEQGNVKELEEILHAKSSECETKLKINGIKQLDKAKAYKLTDYVVQQRTTLNSKFKS